MPIPLGESTISVHVSFYDQRAAGTVRVKRLNRKERTLRSAKRMILILACTAVTVLIPPHVAWLLLGLIVAPVLTYFTFRQEYILREGAGSCPVCKTAISLEPGAIQWPIRENCQSCHRELEIFEDLAGCS